MSSVPLSSSSASEISCTLTVGSTKFEELVDAFLSEECLNQLEALGVGKVEAQIGTSKLSNPNIQEGISKRKHMTIHCFKYSNDIDDYVKCTNLVISHAGSGSLLSFARSNPGKGVGVSNENRRLIIVPNDSLMDSHQKDLAEACMSHGWAFVSKPSIDDLCRSIQQAVSSIKRHDSMSSFPQQESQALNRVLQSL